MPDSDSIRDRTESFASMDPTRANFPTCKTVDGRLDVTARGYNQQLELQPETPAEMSPRSCFTVRQAL